MADRYWVGGSGNTNDTAKWSTSSGGSGGASVPTNSDNAIFDSNSHNTNYTVTVNASFSCLNLTVTAPSSGNMTLAGSSSLNIAGNLSFYSSMIRTYTGAITFSSTSTGKTISTNGVSLDSPITFNGVGGEWTLQNAFITIQGITLTNGSFITNNYNVTCLAFSSNNSNTRTFNPGSSTIYITGNNATVINMATTTNLTIPANTATFDLNYSGSTGTRTISNSYSTERINLKISAGTDILSQSTYQAKSVDFTGFSGTWSGSSTFNFQGNFTISTGMTCSSTGGWTYSDTSGTTYQVITNGKSISKTLFTMNSGTNSSIKFADNLTASNLVMDIRQGILDLSNLTVTISRITDGTGTKIFNFRNSTINLTGTGNNRFSTAGNTVYANGSQINITDTSTTAKTFAGGAHTWHNLSVSGDNVTISGNNTWNKFYNYTAGLTNGLFLTAGDTQTIKGTILSNGTSGNLAKLSSSSAGSPAYIHKVMGQDILDRSTIKDIHKTGASTLYARNSTDVSGNDGIIFTNDQDLIYGYEYTKMGVVTINL